MLNRPQHVAPLVESVRASTTVPHRLLFVTSPGDLTEVHEITRVGCDFIELPQNPGVGDYAKKINLGYRATSEPYVFTGADDLRFHPGWAEAALKAFEREGVGVVGTNDLGNPRVMRGEHATHLLMSRAYADTLGTVDGAGAVYAECYPHEYVDDECIGTARSRNAWAFAPDSIVEHLHPHWGKAEVDALYAAIPQRQAAGAKIFQQRQSRWGATQGRLRPSIAAVSVVIATFGDEEWRSRAARARASVDAQRTSPASIIMYHGSDLATARNEGARQASSEWLCFLDADDELHQNYIMSMNRHLRSSAGLLNPAVQFVHPEGAKPPRMFAPQDLSKGNYLIIGTLVRAKLFWQAGGFDSQWEAWEDWALFRRVVALGGRIARVPQAIYRAHWCADGRNNTIHDKEGLHARIDADFATWRAAR